MMSSVLMQIQVFMGLFRGQAGQDSGVDAGGLGPGPSLQAQVRERAVTHALDEQTHALRL